MADYEALSILLASLVKKENLAKFNCSGDIKGRINIHIQLIGSHESITDLPNMSIRRKSDKQLRRNHQRANSWRDSISTKNCLLLHDSLEVDSDKICDKESPSNVHNSEQGPIVLDNSSVDSHSNDSIPSKSMEHTQSKQPSEITKVTKPKSLPHDSIPTQPEKRTSENVSKEPILPKIRNIFSSSKQQDVPKPKSSHPSTDVVKVMKESTTLPSKPIKRCTAEWCAIRNSPKCCQCTSIEAHPCDYCKEPYKSKLMCERCWNRY